MLGDASLLARPWTGAWPTAPVLACLPLFPFGLPVASGSDRSFWAGSVSRAWSVLPVRRERGLRSVYAHAALTALGVWAYFGAWIVHHAGHRPNAGALLALAHRLRLVQVASLALAVLGGAPALTLLRRPRRSRAGAS